MKFLWMGLRCATFGVIGWTLAANGHYYTGGFFWTVMVCMGVVQLTTFLEGLSK